MILVVGGIKGGSGKTTLATNLTVLRSAKGKKVLLVDADDQKSVSDWIEQRLGSSIKTDWATIQISGSLIYSELRKMQNDYDDIIIDVGGRDTTSQRSALAIADTYLLPFQPRSLDIWTIGSVRKLINEIKSVNPNLKTLAAINRADPKGADNEDAMQVISEVPELKFTCTIGQRKAFANAASYGLGVSELKITDKKAIQEIESLYHSIYENDMKSIP